MRTKKVTLTLSKQTIANLSYDQQLRAKGGVSEAGITIPPCDTFGCDTYGCPTGTNCSCDCESNPMYITCTCPYTETPEC